MTWFDPYFIKGDSIKFGEILADNIIASSTEGTTHDHSDIISFNKSQLYFRKFLQDGIKHIFNILETYRDNEINILLKDLFFLIATLKLKDFSSIVYDYLQEHINDVTCNNEPKIQKYKLALIAYSNIQEPNELAAYFWGYLWTHGPKKFHSIAFEGLYNQDPDLGCEALPLLMIRNKKNADIVLFKMWLNDRCREPLKKALYDDTKPAIRTARGMLQYKIHSTLSIPYKRAVMLISNRTPTCIAHMD